MSTEEIFASAGSVLSAIGAWLWQALLWLFEFFKDIAIGISSWLTTIVFPMMPTFLKLFSNPTVNLSVFFIIVLYIVTMNIYSFMLFGIDKKRSKRRKKMRISEKSLMRSCFWGGAAGGLLGMQIFRHKTQHKKFMIFVPVLFIIQLVLDSILLGFLGFWAFF